MFELVDVQKVFFALFIIFPLVSFIHEVGHLFFAYIFGAKNVKLTIGCGKPIYHGSFWRFGNVISGMVGVTMRI